MLSSALMTTDVKGWCFSERRRKRKKNGTRTKRRRMKTQGFVRFSDTGSDKETKAEVVVCWQNEDDDWQENEELRAIEGLEGELVAPAGKTGLHRVKPPFVSLLLQELLP